MTDNALKTLFYPFENETLPWPHSEALCAFYFAQETRHLSHLGALQIWQPFKHLQGGLPNTALDDQKKDDALCLTPKQKEEAQWALATALNSLKNDGTLIAAASNDAGGKRLEKMFSALGLKPYSESKHKARVVWAKKQNADENIIDQWIKGGAAQTVSIDGDDFISRPGLFSWDRADIGSKLLLQRLPDLNGVGADFGCGYGYLSHHILKKNKDISKLYAIDTDIRATEACKRNAAIEPLWHDLRHKPDLPPLDFILMNPPFHSGKALDIDLGQSFIHTASSCLRKGGTLYMVSNNHLPYESILSSLFDNFEKLDERQGFKILKAIK